MTPDLTQGSVLRAEITGKTYRVQNVDYEAGTISVDGLRPVNLAQIQKDIDNGKITVVR